MLPFATVLVGEDEGGHFEPFRRHNHRLGTTTFIRCQADGRSAVHEYVPAYVSGFLDDPVSASILSDEQTGTGSGHCFDILPNHRGSPHAGTISEARQPTTARPARSSMQSTETSRYETARYQWSVAHGGQANPAPRTSGDGRGRKIDVWWPPQAALSADVPLNDDTRRTL